MEHLIDYPFHRDEKQLWDGESNYTEKCWSPGCSVERDGGGNLDYWAQGVGKMVITEISRHKLPKPYPERVFFTRNWIDPDGKRFGKNNLRILSIGAFTNLLKGFRYDYEVEAP